MISGQDVVSVCLQEKAKGVCLENLDRIIFSNDAATKGSGSREEIPPDLPASDGARPKGPNQFPIQTLDLHCVHPSYSTMSENDSQYRRERSDSYIFHTRVDAQACLWWYGDALRGARVK